MSMQHLTELMDESFRKLKELHNQDDKDNVLLATIGNLLQKLEQRDAVIAEQRALIQKLNKELRNGREREDMAIS